MGAGFIERTGYPSLQGIETQTVGTWVDVTPSNASKTGSFTYGNYGVQTVGRDPVTGICYTSFNCQGVWRSFNNGRTWEGPINTGTNGTLMGEGAGGITVGRNGRIYAGTFRGVTYGFWRSNNGGLDWTNYTTTGIGTPDIYPPTVDPYDQDHLLICGHEQDYLAESFDGGQTWTEITLNAGMLTGDAGTAFCFFVDTGSSSTTADTWLWMGQSNGGAQGTWRTTNGGSSWTKVETNEHPHGACQIYQPDTSGVLYIAGEYATAGSQGVLRSTDYGATYSHVGNSSPSTGVWGTSTTLYSQYGWAIGTPGTVTPGYQTAPQPGTSWTNGSLPAGMADGGFAQTCVFSDGARNIFLSAQWHGGLWRYVE